MKYSGTDAYTGTMTMDANGQKMTMAFDAKRSGMCTRSSVSKLEIYRFGSTV